MSDERTLQEQYEDVQIEAALYIRKQCPGDIGGQMVLAAFMQDSLDHDPRFVELHKEVKP